MNSKMTRRVVLGTLFEGTIACPFVLRALRSHKEVNNAGLQIWRDTWTNLRRKLRPEMEKIASDGNFRCVFDPHRITEASYSILVPLIEEFPYDPQKTPNAYKIVKGTYRVKKFDSNTCLFGQHLERVKVTPAGSKTLLFESGETSWMQSYVPPPVTAEKRRLHKSFSIDYEMVCSISREILGVYRLGNSEVVRVITVRVSQTDEIADGIRSLLQDADPEEQQSLQQELAQTLKYELTDDTRYDSYYDLATGLLVYWEMDSKRRDGKSHQIITQDVAITRVHLFSERNLS